MRPALKVRQTDRVCLIIRSLALKESERASEQERESERASERERESERKRERERARERGFLLTIKK
jgi:hypothetical protein